MTKLNNNAAAATKDIKSNESAIQAKPVATENKNTDEAITENTESLIDTNFKVAIISVSGNIGKTVFKRFLLLPRMPGAEEYSIETINKDGRESKSEIILRGGRFEDLQRSLLPASSAIVDIGASNVEQTMSALKRLEGSHEDYDYFIVPVVKTAKPQADGIKTVHELLKLGVEPEKIKVVFNMVEYKDEIEADFAETIYALETLGVPYDLDAAIEFSSFYPNFNSLGITLEELLATPTKEHKSKIATLTAKRQKQGNLSEEDNDALLRYIELVTTQRYAKTCIRNHDQVFNVLFGHRTSIA